MKIVYIISGLRFGGAEKLLLYTCKALSSRHAVHIDVVCLDPAAEMKRLFNEIGIPVIVLKKNFFSLFKLIKLLMSKRYEIVHTHLIHADTIGRSAALMCRIFYHNRIFSTTHDRYWFRHEPAMVGKLVRMMERCLARPRDSWVLPVSETIRQTLLIHERIPAHKIIPLFNAVEIPDAVRLHKKKGHGLRCLFVGRFIVEKNIPCLLKALTLLPDPHITLTMAGDGPVHDQVVRLIDEYGLQQRVQLLGAVPDTDALYQEHDVLILPSKLEGMPMVVLEAFSRQLPVIAADIPGIRELLGQDRGLLFHADQAAALAQCITHVNDHYEKLSDETNKALAFVRAHHSLAHYVDTLHRLYTEKQA
jgi:L-malate glycosyltransferase